MTDQHNKDQITAIDPYYLNVEFNDITAKSHILNKFDYEFNANEYSKQHKVSNHMNIPMVYDLLCSHIKNNVPLNKTLVTFSPDPAISSSTIAALSEAHMHSQQEGTVTKFLSDLKIVYLTPTLHLTRKITECSIKNLNNSLISNLLCISEPSFTNSNLILDPQQFLLVGINEHLVDESQLEDAISLDVSFLTLKNIRKKGIENTVKYINNFIDGQPYMIVYDMAVASLDTAPCVSRFLTPDIHTIKKEYLNGFTVSELTCIFSTLNSNKLAGIDITGYDFRINKNEIPYRITCESARIPLSKLLHVKEKKINIFNENTRFLIYKPMKDTHWRILNSIPIELREQIMQNIDDDTITTIEIDLNDDGNEEYIFISTTTMNEQHAMSSYDNQLDITKCVLYPEEKVSMMFTLLNTGETSIIK